MPALEPAGHAAFFDLDRTLIPGSSLFLFARGLYELDLFRLRDLLVAAGMQAAFMVRGEQDGGMRRAGRLAGEVVRGRSQSEMRGWGEQIAAERIVPLVYPGVAEIIDGHRRAGDRTVLVTATPQELADPVAEALGMDQAYGTRAQVGPDGCYTGELADGALHGPAKGELVRRLAREQQLDLARSHAYGDSINDGSMLDAVGHPHAVNPDAALLRQALERGWAVHELRAGRRAALVGAGPAVTVGGLLGAGFVAGGTDLSQVGTRQLIRDLSSVGSSIDDERRCDAEPVRVTRWV